VFWFLGFSYRVLFPTLIRFVFTYLVLCEVPDKDMTPIDMPIKVKDKVSSFLCVGSLERLRSPRGG
jgi:hypothetical protein